MAQRIVDLDAVDAERRADDQPDQNDAGQDRRLNRDQPDPLQAEGDASHRPLLDLLDMDFTVAVLLEHGLSSSHIGSNGVTSGFKGANGAFNGPCLIGANP